VITAVALNPAWDRTYRVSRLDPGESHRVELACVVPGGKAINAARVIRLLGGDVTVTGLLGIEDAEHFSRPLRTMEIGTEFVVTRAGTRNTVAVLETAGGRVTEFRERGGPITGDEQRAFASRFRRLLRRARLVVCSGSLPEGLEEDYYRRLIQSADEAEVPVFVDASGEVLRRALDARPYLVKQNLEEVLQLGFPSVPQRGDPVDVGCEGAVQLVARGVSVAVVSLGDEGAVMAWEGGMAHARLSLGCEVANPVGSGDAMVGAMAYAYVGGLDPMEWLRLGVAAGAANALETTAGTLSPGRFRRLVEGVEVRQMRRSSRGEC